MMPFAADASAKTGRAFSHEHAAGLTAERGSMMMMALMMPARIAKTIRIACEGLRPTRLSDITCARESARRGAMPTNNLLHAHDVEKDDANEEDREEEDEDEDEETRVSSEERDREGTTDDELVML